VQYTYGGKDTYGERPKKKLIFSLPAFLQGAGALRKIKSPH